jgi:hypothetical protein
MTDDGEEDYPLSLLISDPFLCRRNAALSHHTKTCIFKRCLSVLNVMVAQKLCGIHKGGKMIIGRFLEEYLRDHGESYQELLKYLYGNEISLQDTIWSDIIPDTNRTILMSSVKSNCYQICQVILSQYPQCINIVNSQGLSALHYAAFHGHLALVLLLRQHGAHCHLKNNYSEYPFDSAAISGHSDLEYVMLSQFLFGYRPFDNQNPVARNYDPASVIDRSRRNLEWIEEYNFNFWSLDLPFPLLLDDYLLNSSSPSTPMSHSTALLPATLVTNSFEDLSFLQRYSLIIRQNLSGGTEKIGKEFDIFCSPPDSSLPRPTTITIGRSQSNWIILNDLSISKSHCELTHFEGIGLCLKDCQSRHGTSVDGVTVLPNQTPTGPSTGYQTNMIIIKYPTATITVGRVVLGFHQKPIPKTVAKRSVFFPCPRSLPSDSNRTSRLAKDSTKPLDSPNNFPRH